MPDRQSGPAHGNAGQGLKQPAMKTAMINQPEECVGPEEEEYVDPGSEE